MLAFLAQRTHEVDDNKTILEALLNRAKALNPPDKNKMYEAVNGIDWSNCNESKVIYISHIKELLMQNNVPIQEAGFMALHGACQRRILSATEKREIVGPCIDWLDDLKPGAASQVHTIRSVQLLWETVRATEREPVRNKFIGFTFDKLICQSTVIDNIRLGFEVLRSLEPSVTEETHKSYFEDISARMEKESNDSIKKELEVGINGLRGVQEKII